MRVAASAPSGHGFNFIILVGVLGYLIAKNMGPMLVARTQKRFRKVWPPAKEPGLEPARGQPWSKLS